MIDVDERNYYIQKHLLLTNLDKLCTIPYRNILLTFPQILEYYVKYDCELENCMQKTDGFICEYHHDEILKENALVTVCESCCKILKIEIKESKPITRYILVKDCMRCQRQIEPGMF